MYLKCWSAGGGECMATDLPPAGDGDLNVNCPDIMRAGIARETGREEGFIVEEAGEEEEGGGGEEDVGWREAGRQEGVEGGERRHCCWRG